MKTLITLFALFGAIQLSAQVPSYVPTNGLVGWWPFDGDATDQSTNGNDGTVNGANLTTNRNSKGASAYLFDGNNDYINCGNIPALQGATALTLAAWVNIDTKSGSARIISNEYHVTNDEGARIQLTYNTGNNFAGGVSDTTHGAGAFDCTGTSLNTNTWYHVVMVFDGTGSNNTDRMKVYVNGNLESISYTFNIPTLSTNRNSELWIGGIYNSASLHGFHGKIDDVGVWDRALTASEVTTLYQSSNTSTLSLEQNDQIQLYPNPTFDKVNVVIESAVQSSFAYTLIAADGKVVEIGTLEQGRGAWI